MSPAKRIRNTYYADDDPHRMMRQVRNFIIIAITVFLGVLGTGSYEFIVMGVNDHFILKSLNEKFIKHEADQQVFTKELNDRIRNAPMRGGSVASFKKFNNK